MKKSFGFTLAELMIVMSVIGILAAVLIPIANNSRPDENVMKFKKANITLGNAIRELITSDQYYADGDFGKMANGNPVSSATYFCQTLADVLNTKNVNCSDAKEGNQIHIHLSLEDGVDTTPANKKSLDQFCKDYQKEEIKTTDNITYYLVDPSTHFAANYQSGSKRLFGQTDWGYEYTTNAQGERVCTGIANFDMIYKVFCVDVDGIPKNDTNKGANCDDKTDVCPFGYGIRADGKILSGERADQWMEKSIQKGGNK